MALTKVSRGLLTTSIVDNGNATAITIDSSENVGIGRTPNANGVLQLNVATGNNCNITLSENDTEKFLIGALTGSNALRIYDLANNAERMRIDSIGNVGIGSSPVVWSTGMRALELKGYSGTTKQGSIAFDSHSGANGYNLISTDTGNMVFYNGATNRASAVETMRISSSGNVGIGASTYEGSVTSNASSVWISSAGYISANINNDWGLGVNRTGTDGTLINLRKNGADVGAIGNSGTRFVVHGTYTNGAGLYFGSNVLLPTNNVGALSDGTVSLGQSNYRYNTVFAASGSINTSDRNEKQDIEALSDAERRVAVAAKGLMRKFRWIDSVETKGDDARIHFGIIAQDLQDAFTAEDLDAAHYGMWCSDTWTDEDTGEERTRLGVRYSELLAFIIAAI